MCKIDFMLFSGVAADNGFYRKIREITFCVIISLQVVGFSQNSVETSFSMIPMQCLKRNSKFFRKFFRQVFKHFRLAGLKGGSSTHHPPNLARTCPTLKKLSEGRATLPTTACKVSSLYLKSKSF